MRTGGEMNDGCDFSDVPQLIFFRPGTLVIDKINVISVGLILVKQGFVPICGNYGYCLSNFKIFLSYM